MGAILHHRRSIRMEGHDYTQPGGYFVTIVTEGRINRFGEIHGEEIHLNSIGEMVQREWQALPRRFPDLEAGAFIVMPNHIHGILLFGGGLGAASQVKSTAEKDKPPLCVKPGSLGAIVRAFKVVTTLNFHRLRGNSIPLWQRNYYEHIIRGKEDWESIYAYILANPATWEADQINPSHE